MAPTHVRNSEVFASPEPRRASRVGLLQTDAGRVTRRQNIDLPAASFLTLSVPAQTKGFVKNILLILAAVVLAGCAGTHPKGLSRVDEFDAVKVDQMEGNNVSPAALQKVIVCLNARRESRPITALTNMIPRSVTNVVVQAITNETITVSTNFLVTTMTNLAPSLAGATGVAGAPVSEEAVAAAAAASAATVSDAPTTLAVTNAAPAFGTNVTASFAQNSSATAGPSQRGANNQIIRTYNNQITTTSNNLSVSLMTNLVVSMETNAAVTFLTNYLVFTTTNVVITPTNSAANDYFLYTEVIPPPDFTLQPSGESLILLVDGVRHGFNSAPSGTAFQARRGFTSTFYRVTPEVLVAIANAREVRLRLRGTSSVIERSLNERSRENFKTFLVRYFSPETIDPGQPPAPSPAKAKASVQSPAPGSLATLP